MKSTQRPQRAAPVRMLSLAEAAERLGVSPRSVGRYLDAGTLDYGVYPSGRRMVSEASVALFIERSLAGRL